MPIFRTRLEPSLKWRKRLRWNGKDVTDSRGKVSADGACTKTTEEAMGNLLPLSFLRTLINPECGLAIRADFVLLKRLDGAFHGKMNIQHRVEVSQIEQVAHERIRPSTLQDGVLALGPGVKQGQLAEASAIHGTHAAEIQNQLARVFQDFGDQTRQCS